jgi:hypothetical protein
MPVKRRQGKRRLGEAAELEAWGELFTCGYDFFGDLEPFGFPGGDTDRAARAAAPQAWKRLGIAYLETAWADRYKGSGQRQTPWAVEEFGYPKGWRDAG